MLSYSHFLTEQSRKTLDIMMTNYGYGRPAVGAEGHISYTNKDFYKKKSITYEVDKIKIRCKFYKLILKSFFLSNHKTL